MFFDSHSSCYRYIPLSRINIPLPTESFSGRRLHFPSLSACEEIEKAASSSLIRCKLRSVEAAAKVCFSHLFSLVIVYKKYILYYIL